LDAALTADGGRVITLALNGQAQLWDGASGRAFPGVSGHGRMILSGQIGFSPDGQLAVSAGQDRAVRLWSSATGQLARELEHTYPVWQVAFNASGERLVTASFEPARGGEVRIYSTATGQRLDSFPLPSAWRALLSPDGRQSLAVTDSSARLYGGPGGKEG